MRILFIIAQVQHIINFGMYQTAITSLRPQVGKGLNLVEETHAKIKSGVALGEHERGRWAGLYSGIWGGQMYAPSTIP